MNILWKYLHENRHGSIYEQYMSHKWVWRFGSKEKAQKKKKKKEKKKKKKKQQDMHVIAAFSPRTV